jgi:putative oxygen-independent coproporphyrinogen III oxidase
MSGAEPGFGIYVHWPFCRSKCPYCDFNSHVRDRIDEARWRAALLADLDYFADLTGPREVTSIFFGGGTPSLMSPETTAAVIERVAARWRLVSAAEITLEANPTSVEAEKFQGFRAAGVNRVSLGVQALEAEALGFLGRTHDPEEAIRAIGIAARYFDRFSFDLIYARPGQTLDAWGRELRRALDLAVGHLSLYQLTIEPGTAFHTAHSRGDFALPDDDLAGAFYEMTQQVLNEAGLPAYEISNHARPGEASRHNLTYWRYGDYVGAGPGAHGRLTLDGRKYAFRQKRAPESWLAAVDAVGHGTEEQVEVTAAERLDEQLMMGLRLAEGVPLRRIVEETGRSVGELIAGAALDRLIEGGFLTLDETRLAATEAGRQRLNAVLGMLLAG